MYTNVGEPRCPGAQRLHKGAQAVQVTVQACSPAPSPLTPTLRVLPSQSSGELSSLLRDGAGGHRWSSVR